MNPSRLRTKGTIACAVACALAAAAAPLRAGSLGSEPSLGLSAGFQSNPLLDPNSNASAETLALLLNLPVAFNGRRSTFTLSPRLRAGATRGEVAPLSNYQYVDANWDYKGERNELVADAEWHRDSTLYNQYERSVLGGNTLRRLEETGSLTWRHDLSERSTFQLQGAEDRVLYGAEQVQTLTSFNYGQGSAKYGYQLSENWQASLEGGFTRYELRDQSYRTDATYVQFGLARTLSEYWSLSMSAGASALKSRQFIERYVIEQDPQGALHIVLKRFELHSGDHTRSYALSAKRQFEQWELNLSGSRALQPSGFGALATQDDLSLRATGHWSERLTLSGTLHGSRLSDASGRLNLGSRRYYDCDLSANWQWREHWSVEAQAALYMERAAASSPTRSNVLVFLTLTRQFGRQGLN